MSKKNTPSEYEAAETLESAPQTQGEQTTKSIVEPLSDKEKDALRVKAREMAAKAMREKEEEDFLKRAVAEEKKKLLEEKGRSANNEEMVHHTVDLSSASDRHIINGKHYLHGQTYYVPKSLADFMRDVEFRGHVQEDIRKGNNRNEYGFKIRDGIRSGVAVA